MTPSTPPSTPQAHSSPRSARQGKPAAAPFCPAPLASISHCLADYIQAAASGDRNSIFYLFSAVFASVRATVRCLVEHYDSHPHSRTFDCYCRLKYCLSRLPALFYTLKNAPERFLKPAQLRALTRCRAVLAHIWREPVDFDPLTPFLSAPENCPPPPRACADPPIPARPVPVASAASSGNPACADTPSNEQAAIHSVPASESNPLLLQSPGRVLAGVLLQLAAVYGLSAKPVAIPRPGTGVTSSSSAPASTPPAQSSPMTLTAASADQTPRPGESIPHSAIFEPQSPGHLPP